MLQRLILLLGLFLMVQTAQAALVSDLYAVDVPVATQDATAYQLALPQAFQQVLVKVSGNSRVNTLPAPKQIERFVRSYRYFTSPVSGLTVHVDFDPDVVDKTLQAAHQNEWGNERPLLLTWLTLREPKIPPYLLTSGDNRYQLSYLLQQNALRRGVPIILPNDVDKQYISPWLAVNSHQSTFWQASQRYRHDGILVGQCSLLTTNVWQCDWQLHVQYSQFNWQTKGGSLNQNILAGIDRAADTLAQRYAVASQSANEYISLVISGVNDLSAHTKVLDFLHHIKGIQHLQVQSVVNGEMHLNLQIAGGAKALQQVLTFERSLHQEVSMTPGQLQYRYLSRD